MYFLIANEYSAISVSGSVSSGGYGIYVANGIISSSDAIYINTTTSDTTNPIISIAGSGIYINGGGISSN